MSKEAAKQEQGRCCRSVKFAKELLRHTFFKTDFDSEKKSLEEKLITKSWVCHCILSALRLVFTISTTPYYKTVYKPENLHEEIDVDFVQDSKDTVQTLRVCASLLGLVLDIVVWRRRQYGLLIYPLEIIALMLMGLMPFDFGFFGDIMPMMIFSFAYLLFAVPTTKTHAVLGTLSYLAF